MLTANRFVVSLISLLLFPSYAHAAGLVESGKDIANQWCASCHLVAEDQKSASADVPTFSSIASKYGNEVDYLSGFLADPHPSMPNFTLTRQEIKGLLAYIKSLKQN